MHLAGWRVRPGTRCHRRASGDARDDAPCLPIVGLVCLMPHRGTNGVPEAPPGDRLGHQSPVGACTRMRRAPSRPTVRRSTVDSATVLGGSVRREAPRTAAGRAGGAPRRPWHSQVARGTPRRPPPRVAASTTCTLPPPIDRAGGASVHRSHRSTPGWPARGCAPPPGASHHPGHRPGGGDVRPVQGGAWPASGGGGWSGWAGRDTPPGRAALPVTGGSPRASLRA